MDKTSSSADEGGGGGRWREDSGRGRFEWIDVSAKEFVIGCSHAADP